MRILSLFILGLLVPVILPAQEMSFITQPAARKVGIQDPFEVQYILKNARDVESFSLPRLTDLQVLSGPRQSTRFSDINGERSVTIELTYVFKARRKGTVTIPGGIALMDGREIRSNAVNVEVIEGSVIDRQARRRQSDPFADDPFFQDAFGDDPFAAIQRQHQQMMQMMQRSMGPAPLPVPRSAQASAAAAEPIGRAQLGENLFIRVEADKRQVNLGEQITVSYKLYTRLPMEINLTRLPSLNGFWSQDFKLPQPPKPVKEIYQGKEFQVFEIKRTALFPTQTGSLELDAAEAEGVARLLKPRRVRQQDPFADDPFFNSFFGSMMMSDPAFDEGFLNGYDHEDVPVKLKSTPIRIAVNPIPSEQRPASFNGAVGQYTLESNIDRTELSTDDAATVTLKVTGTGNLKMIGAPALSVPADLDLFDPKETDTITNTNDIIAGYKTFSYVLSPRVPGTFTIPSAEFTFYDPNTKEFKTLSTPSYTLHVKPGRQDDATAQHRLPRDIHDIHSAPARLSASRGVALPESQLFWSGFALPLLAYMGLLAYRKKEDDLQRDVVRFRNKRAGTIAMKRLASAERYLKQQAQRPFYEETSKAVWLYVSDKLNIPLSTLSKEIALQKLNERGIPQLLQTELLRVADECEMALYSPDHGSMKMNQTYTDAFRLIGKLEDELS
jgi:hypothetical protein